MANECQTIACDVPAATVRKEGVRGDTDRQQQIASPPPQSHLSSANESSRCVRETATIGEDSTLWADQLTDKGRIKMVNKGPIQISDIKFPKKQKHTKGGWQNKTIR